MRRHLDQALERPEDWYSYQTYTFAGWLQRHEPMTKKYVFNHQLQLLTDQVDCLTLSSVATVELTGGGPGSKR